MLARVGYNSVEPTVIDDEILKKAVVEQVKGDAADVARKEGIDPSEVLSLRLDYKNILKIDNLWAYNKLTKLQLDNNILEKIENINFLKNLTWLDLSFNNIEVIEGLEGLTKLTDLTLYNNRISVIQNMNDLINLNAFSIGNNLLGSLENLLYLRRFENLRLLNCTGNQICKQQDYRDYVLAHIKQIKYLDYRLVDQDAIRNARRKYQDELIALEENEKIQVAQKEEEDRNSAQEKTYKAAHIVGIDTLFDSMFSEDVDFRKLCAVSENTLREFKEGYFAKFEPTKDEMRQFILKQNKIMQDELGQFQKCTDDAKSDYVNQGVKLIKQFQQKKKQLLRTIHKNRDSKEAEECFTQLKEAVNLLSDVLMANEMQLVEQLEDVIKEFERNYSDIVTATIENAQGTFARLRDLENEYHEKVTEAMMQTYEKYAKNDIAELDDDLRDVLGDKDTLTNILNGSHDFHLGKYDVLEDNVVSGMTKDLESLFQSLHEKEEHRSRERVAEIIHFGERCQQELEQAEEM